MVVKLLIAFLMFFIVFDPFKIKLVVLLCFQKDTARGADVSFSFIFYMRIAASQAQSALIGVSFRYTTVLSVFGGRKLCAVCCRSLVNDCRTRVCVEEIGDLVLDARDDLAVEESHHCSDEQRAEYDSDDDLDAFGDVEVTVFIGDSGLCFFLDGLSLQVSFGGESVDGVLDVFHGVDPFLNRKMCVDSVYRNRLFY